MRAYFNLIHKEVKDRNFIQHCEQLKRGFVTGKLSSQSFKLFAEAEKAVAKKAKYLELNSDKDWYRLKVLSDIQVAQFFIPKTIENNNKIITDSDYFEFLYNFT